MSIDLSTFRRFPTFALLLLALVLTAIVYWPSLHGGYVFDDYPNIVQNPPVHVKTLSWQELRGAAMSSPSPELIRPLAMLSFGIDWYFGHGDPLPMKCVNLLIHLIDGLLVFFVVRRLARHVARRYAATSNPELLAACVAAAWLLAPINFTAVAYIVQRMESLCQVFVLAGLWGYIAARERMIAGRGGMAAAAVSIVVGTIIGALAKESALLLPLYCAIAEWALFDFRRSDGRRDWRITSMFVLVLVLPGCVAAAWALAHVLPASAWANRPFTLTERLLTEPRILFDYVHWSLLPSANSLSLYHDSIAFSTGLLHPATTLAGIAGLAAAAIVAIVARTHWPLVALGLGWFLGAHLLTATVIPLELVFEHRNYFASIGLYLLLFSLLLPAPRASMTIARSTACIGILALFAIVTHMRALDWSNPVAFATSEAAKNPASPRTAYELARTYVVLSQYDPQSPLIPEAFRTMEKAASMPRADALPDQGLLMLYGRLHRDVPKAVWTRLEHKLATQPLTSQNISALHEISECAVAGACDFPGQYVVLLYVTVLQRAPNAVNVLSSYANYAINVLHDATLALDLARTAVSANPGNLQARKNLLLLLTATDRRDEALEQYHRILAEIPGAESDPGLKALAAPLLEPDAARPPDVQSSH